MSVSGIIGILTIVVLVVGLAGWGAYAYRNPHSTSGQMLIRVREKLFNRFFQSYHRTEFTQTSNFYPTSILSFAHFHVIIARVDLIRIPIIYSSSINSIHQNSLLISVAY